MHRMQWKGKLEFLFACFGYSVGLGNIWRFPYRCYNNGGGAFLIPYFISLVFCTFPLLLMEMLLGQFASQGPITIWKFCPIFKGVGWAIIFNVFITNISYIVIVMYSLFYMLVAFVSIGSPLPWQHCSSDNKEWITKLCRDSPLPDFDAMHYENEKINAYANLLDQDCLNNLNLTIIPSTFADYKNTYESCAISFVSPEKEYWNRFVLKVHESNGIDHLGSLVGRNVLGLLVAWWIVYYCLVKGIRELSKVIYITASFPTLILLVLLARGLTLDGSEVGIAFYTTADWEKLKDLSIWSSASTQNIYSVGVAFGAHIALASHNRFHNNLFRDATILTLFNTLTSILGGFVVFSFLGHASVKLNRPLNEIFDQGPGLIFISYLQGISQLPGSAVWAFLFFIVVFTLGVDSVFVMVWTIYVAIEDAFPKIFLKYGRYIHIAMCILPFILGLPLVTKGGIHMLVVMDRYTSDFNLTLFLILECIAVCWVYGLKRFTEDVAMMLGKINPVLMWYLKCTWTVSAPGFCLFIFIASGVGYTTVSYNGIETTATGEAIGILLIITPFLIAVGFGSYKVKKYGLRVAATPSEHWGPRLAEHREGKYSPADYIHPVP